MKYYILDLKQRVRVGCYPNLKQARKALNYRVLEYGPPEPYRYCLDDDRQPVMFVRVK